MLHPFLLGLFWLLPLGAQAHFSFTPQLQQSYEAIIDMRIEPARKLILAEQARDPQNALCDYLLHSCDFVMAAVVNDPAMIARADELEAATIKRLEREASTSPWYYYCLAEVKLHWAFVATQQQEYLKSFGGYRSAYKNYEACLQHYPAFMPAKKGIGIMQVMIGSAPAQYTRVLGWLGLKGSVPQGMKLLAEAEAADGWWHTETVLMHQYIRLFMLREEASALKELDELYRSNRESNLLQLLYSAALLQTRRADKALAVLSNRENKNETAAGYTPVYYLALMQAEALVRLEKYEAAIKAFQFFIKYHKSPVYKREAQYKIATCYHLMGEADKAKVALDEVSEMGTEKGWSDKRATKRAAEGLPDPDLAKATFAFEGGRYEASLGYLAKLEARQLDDAKAAEVQYRKGRALQELGRNQQAIAAYNVAITEYKDVPVYYPAYSALFLGRLYEKLGQKPQAIAHYKLAMTFRKHEHVNSVERQAKTALSNLGK